MSLLVLSLLAVVLPVLPTALVGAQSQNEVITTVLYDGTDGRTARFGDAAGSVAPAGTAPEAHGAGDDAGPNNLVVRTHDQFAIRVDWNVNEDHATDVTLTTVLPAYAEWTTDETLGYAGCVTTTFPDPQTAVCVLDAQEEEGSNGAIRMTALMNEELDGTTFDVVSTLTTGEDAAGVSDGLDQELTVSEAPFVDYFKDSPTTSEIASGGGYVLLYPLSFQDYSQGTTNIGIGPILDSVPVDLWDHMWSLTPSARLATPAEMTAAGFAGPVCGDYDAANGGAYVAGGTNGTWVCGAEAPGAGGYNVVPISVSGFTSRPFPATLADGSVNGPAAPQISSGQIAIYLTEAEVQAAIADPDNADSVLTASFDNTLAGVDGATVIDDVSILDLQDATGSGTGGGTNNGAPGNNTASATFGEVPTTGGGNPGAGIFTGHDIRWTGGPLQLAENLSVAEGPFVQSDNEFNVIPGTSAGFHARTDNPSGFIGEVSRGQTVTLTATAHARGEGEQIGLHQCIALDTSHYNLVDLPASIPVRQHLASATASGYSSATPTDGIAHVVTGQLLVHTNLNVGTRLNNGMGIGGDADPWAYEVQVASAPIPAVGGQTGIAEDGLTCNDADAAWVSATGDLSSFDADGDGLYEGIQLVRVVSTELGTITYPDGFSQAALAIATHLNVRVLQDLAVNSNGQELFAFTSHSYTQDAGWDGTGALPGNLDCNPHASGGWNSANPDGSGDTSVSGWCSNEFIDDGANSFDTGDAIAYDLDTAGIINRNRLTQASGTVLEIVGASLGLSKTNNDGLTDIADNGDTVTFTIRPTVVGAQVEALTNVNLVDQLPANYEYVSHTQPTTAGSSCTFDPAVGPQGAIECQYSEPVPGTDTGALPDAIAGGWPNTATGDSAFEVTVLVTGAIANPDNATILTNSATVTSDGLGPWDPDTGAFIGPVAAAKKSRTDTASSSMPLPADEGAIVKNVDTLLGPCVAPPGDFLLKDINIEAWPDRCSLIQEGDNMSFILELENEGNTAFTNIEIIDVFPYVGDSVVEPASETLTDIVLPDGSPNTVGDARNPASDFTGNLGFVSLTDINTPSASTTYVTGDAPATVSRDPLTSFTNAGNTWCSAVGGAAVNGGTGACPAAATDVTATYTHIAGDLNPQETIELQLTLSTEGAACEQLWTNTFGSRVDQIFLPIRSNDVSVQTIDCFETGIDIVKNTNGEDGHETVIGSAIEWTYDVENTGTTALANATVADSDPSITVVCAPNNVDNVIPLLLPGEIVRCTASGIATDLAYSNDSTVSGEPIVPDFSSDPSIDPNDPSTWPTDPAAYQVPNGPDGLPLEDPEADDPSSYLAEVPEASIGIDKITNEIGDDIEVVAGTPVTWTYVVENTGATALQDAEVTDDQGVVVVCDINNDGVFDDATAIIPFFLPGESVTCQGTGTAQPGPYSNNSTVSGTPVTPDFSDPSIDPNDPSTWPADPAAYGPTLDENGLPLADVDAEDPSNYFGTVPEASIGIDKITNEIGDDIEVVAGTPVTWTYVVENTGATALQDAEVTDDQGVVVVCDINNDGVFDDATAIIPFFLPGESVTCQGTGTAQPGPYSNNSTVSGTPVTPDFSDPSIDPNDPSTWPADPAAYAPTLGEDGLPLADVAAEDPSNYFGDILEAAVDIVKNTNGEDDHLTVAGAPITWTYDVENTGATALQDAVVADSDPAVTVDCDVDGDGVFDGTDTIPFLAVGDIVNCQATGTAIPGPYSNNSTVSGTPIVPDFSDPAIDPLDPTTWPTDPALYGPAPDENGDPQGPVDAEDPSNYFGMGPEASINIEKDTNGADSDTAPGEVIPAGDIVVWTYVVTNDGNTALADATVSDDQGVVVHCDYNEDGVFDDGNVIPFLEVAASVTCEGTGTAQSGQYTNNSTVVGNPIVPDFALYPDADPNDPSTWPTDPAAYVAAIGEDGLPLGPVDHEDPSNYFGLGVLDLALEKTIAAGQDVSNLAIGDDVTFTIEVFNQGTLDATDVSLIDYTPAQMELNDADWTEDSDGNATIDLTGVTIAPGGSTTVDITMTILAAGDIDNQAEITGQTAVDVAGNGLFNVDGSPILDVDSITDAENSDVLSDGVLDNADNDEDDHDVASITVAEAVLESAPSLAFTGTESLDAALLALLMLMLGLGFVMTGRRFRNEDA